MFKSLISISAAVILFFFIVPFLAGMFGFDDDILSAVGMEGISGGGVGLFGFALFAMGLGVPFLVFLTVLDKIVSFVRKNKSKSSPESIDKSEPVAPKAETSDVEQNKPFAIIGYVIPVLFFIPMLAEKKSPFGMFHAKQQLNLLLSGIAVQVVGGMIPTPGWLISFLTGSLVLIAKPFAIIGCIISVLFFISMLAEKKSPFGLLLLSIAVNILGMILFLGWFSIAPIILIVLAIMGIINAAKGEMKQLPFIGGFQIIK
jgi:uncharacterized membrane protein